MTKTVSVEATEASVTEASLADDDGIFEEVALGEGGANGLGETTTEAVAQLETTTEAVATDEAETTTSAAASVKESGDGEDEEEEESLNEIDTDGFVVSQDTLDSAKKYGYKILLKKVKMISFDLRMDDSIWWLRWATEGFLWARLSSACQSTTTKPNWLRYLQSVKFDSTPIKRYMIFDLYGWL